MYKSFTIFWVYIGVFLDYAHSFYNIFSLDVHVKSLLLLSSFLATLGSSTPCPL